MWLRVLVHFSSLLSSTKSTENSHSFPQKTAQEIHQAILLKYMVFDIEAFLFALQEGWYCAVMPSVVTKRCLKTLIDVDSASVQFRRKEHVTGYYVIWNKSRAEYLSLLRFIPLLGGVTCSLQFGSSIPISPGKGAFSSPVANSLFLLGFASRSLKWG